MIKKNSIFIRVLIPVVVVMLIQTLLISLALFINGTIRTLDDNAMKSLQKNTENRKITLENMMVHNWANLEQLESAILGKLNSYLDKNALSLDDVLGDSQRENKLLHQLSNPLLETLRSKSSTGAFFYFIDETRQELGNGKYNGLYYRDLDPISTPTGYSDVLCLRGFVDIARKVKIPLDRLWSESFTFPPDNAVAYQSFYKPYQAALANPQLTSKNLSYWSTPHVIHADGGLDTDDCITYTSPLLVDGRVIGMMGTEIQLEQLEKYFPSSDFDADGMGGYLLLTYPATDSAPSRLSCTVQAVTGNYASRFFDANDQITMSVDSNDNVYKMDSFPSESIHVALQPLKLYNPQSPFHGEQWALASIAADPMLFSSSRSVKVGILYASITALVIGILMLAVLIRHSTKPLIRITDQIEHGNPEEDIAIQNSNTYEISLLCDTINAMKRKQKNIEMALRAERERYLVALESAADTFVEYDFEQDNFMIYFFSPGNHKPDLTSRTLESFLSKIRNNEICHPEDTEAFASFLTKCGRNSIETRVKAELLTAFFADDETDDGYHWFSLKASHLCDDDGRIMKIIGIARHVTSEKLTELRELEESRRDPSTKLYNRKYGKYLVKKEISSLSERNDPFFLCILHVDDFDLFETYYGRVFGGILLMYLGRELQDAVGETGVAVRMENDKFMLLLPFDDEAELEDRLQQVNLALSRLYAGENPDLRFRVSAGFASSFDHGDYVSLYRMAYQAALYAAKSKHVSLQRYRDLPANVQNETFSFRNKPVSVFLDLSKEGIVSLVFDAFERSTDIHSVIHLLLRVLGELFELNQIILCAYDADFGANQVTHQWNDGAFHPYHSHIEQISFDDFNALEQSLDENGVLLFQTATLRSCGEGVQKLLCSHPDEECSALACAMYINGIRVGMALFKSKDASRTWSDAELFNLYEITKTISAHLHIEKSNNASKAKSEFLSRVSHEIRTPMNAIIGMTSIAMESVRDEARLRDCLSKIDFSSKHLLSLINDVLDMSRIESGKLIIAEEPFSLANLTETVDILMRPQLEAKNLTFTIQLETRHFHVVGDEYRLRQVLVNLIGNAGKFTNAGGSIVFTIREEEADETQTTLHFAVKDTGIGIAKEDQPNIFKAFEQAESDKNVKKRHDGTGLGLAISSRIVAAMNGKIQLQSEPNKGSIFSFTLTMTLGEKDLEAEAATQQTAEEPPRVLDGKRVLLAEDNEINAEITTYVLEKEGLSVEIAENGKEAVERFFQSEQGYYDLILMDIQMPIMDGLTATREIRKNVKRRDARTVPIVAMTANAFDEDMKKSIESGMNGHLAKPIENEKMFELLQSLLTHQAFSFTNKEGNHEA